MSRKIGSLLTVCLLIFGTAAHAAGADSHAGPSEGAKGMAGAMGTFVFTPSDHEAYKTKKTYWIDTDGVQPGIAGCHIGTNADGKPNGRAFAEACIDSRVLVESNPGANTVHDHTNDVGHPDKFDCLVWCRGQGHSGGTCQVASAPPPCTQSARCACN